MRCFVRVALVILVLPLAAEESIPDDKSIQFYSGTPRFEIAPWSIEHIREPVSRFEPAESMEALYTIQWPEDLCGDEEALRECVKEALLHISEMEGLPYPDSSGSAGDILFHDSYVVASPENREPLPDPSLEDFTDELQLFVLQDDNDFGEVVMQVTIRSDERYTIQVQNATRLRLGILPSVAPGNMLLYLDLLPEEDALHIYGVGALDVARLKLFRGLIRDHLETRADALVDWMRQELHSNSR
ncbi:MAG: DUF6675 family protein [Spirochaeta sp.]